MPIRLEAQQTTPWALRAEMKALAGLIRPLVEALPYPDVVVSHPALNEDLRQTIDRVFAAEGYGVSVDLGTAMGDRRWSLS